MKWLINIIMCQLILGQALSHWSCLKTEKCSCNKSSGEEEIIVTCNSSTVKANWKESTIQINCESELTQWEKSFDQINITNLYYTDCFLFDAGIKQIISTLGINDIQDKLILRHLTLVDSLERYYLSNLEHLKVLEISYTKNKLILTNESFQGTPNLTELYLSQNEIEEIPSNVFIHLTQLVILDLGGNKISRIDSKMFVGIPLIWMILTSNNLKTFSFNIQTMKYLDISNNYDLTEISDQPFQNTSLQKIRFFHGHFTVPNRFLSSLNQLQLIHLIDLNLDKVPEGMIQKSPNITELSLASNRLTELPESFFQDSLKMKVLNLSKNHIKEIKSELLKPLMSLEKLDLSNNFIFQIQNNRFSHLEKLTDLNLNANNIIHIELTALNLQKLKHLKLAHNKISSLYFKNKKFLFSDLSDVEDIDLSHNSITRIGPGDWNNLIKLKFVNISNNNFTILKIIDMQFLNAHVQLDSNPLQLITEFSILKKYAFEQSQIKNDDFASKRKLTLSSDQFICDGRNYEFGMFLQNKMPQFVLDYLKVERQNLTCNNGIEFKSIPMDGLTYDWELFNDSNKSNCTECTCTYRPSDESAVMNCSNRNLTLAPKHIITSKNIKYTDVNLSNNSITKLPDYKSLTIRKLDVSYNKLNVIDMIQLPINLRELRLDHNSLVDIGEINYNMSTNLEHLTMSGNPWTCECEGKNTIDFINKYSKKINDSDNVTCFSDPSKKLETLSPDDLCQSQYPMIFLIIFLAVLGIVFGLVLALYKTEIAVQLHHYLPTMFPDKQGYYKKYSAFISFAHEDRDIVQKDIIPKLETDGTQSFKLCVHNRDWEVGELIPDQIIRSVQESHRTIILVTPNFLKSHWCHMEFETAFLNTVKERKKNIIIFFENLTVADLDPQFQKYVSLHTYIEWGDPNFWERLKYALRHDKVKKKKIDNY